jgi:Ni/Fe-hydrogenase 1 B-type cytochrome subunit
VSLAPIEVWIDVAFAAIYVCVWLFLIWHFSMFVITGRFKKAFIEGNWPEHDSRPPAAPKVAHAIHMFGMLILAFTGMAIRFEWFGLWRPAMQNTHYVVMIIVIITVIWRVWYAFRSKTNADYREFTIGKVDVQSLPGILKYYGYLSNDKPHVAKYNVAQKGSYNLFLVMMTLQALTGLAIWRVNIPATGLSLYAITAALVTATGVVWIRMAHYVLNWAFIIMMTVHAYLAFTVDIPCMQDFFGFKELQVKPGHGHGHGEPVPEAPALGEVMPQA